MYLLGALFIVIVFFVVLRLASWMPPQPEPPQNHLTTADEPPIEPWAEYRLRRYRWYELELSLQKKKKSPPKLDDYPF